MIVGGGARSREDEAPAGIEGQSAPGVAAGGCAPGFSGPRFVPGFAGMWNGVKDPATFARANIVGAEMTGRLRGGAVIDLGADDEQIAVDDSRRCQADRLADQVAIEAFPEIDTALRAEGRDQPSVRGIDGVDIVSRGREQAAF